jgi:hypothetical protein
MRQILSCLIATITTLAYLQRKFGVVPEPMATPEPPLQVGKAELLDFKRVLDRGVICWRLRRYQK